MERRFLRAEGCPRAGFSGRRDFPPQRELFFFPPRVYMGPPPSAGGVFLPRAPFVLFFPKRGFFFFARPFYSPPAGIVIVAPGEGLLLADFVCFPPCFCAPRGAKPPLWKGFFSFFVFPPPPPKYPREGLKTPPFFFAPFWLSFPPKGVLSRFKGNGFWR